MEDFNRFKTETNMTVTRLSDQFSKETLELKAKLDDNAIVQKRIQDNAELAEERFIEFDARRVELLADLVEVKRQSVLIEQQKIDESRAAEEFKDIRGMIKANTVFQENVRNDLLTLENYVERYLPLTTIKIIKRCMQPLYDADQLKKLDKAESRYTMEMQQ